MTILWPPFVGWMVFCSLLFRILSRTRVYGQSLYQILSSSANIGKNLMIFECLDLCKPISPVWSANLAFQNASNHVHHSLLEWSKILQLHVNTRHDITSYGMMGSFIKYHSVNISNSNSLFTHCLRRNRRISLIPHKHFIQRL